MRQPGVSFWNNNMVTAKRPCTVNCVSTPAEFKCQSGLHSFCKWLHLHANDNVIISNPTRQSDTV